jgi:hypothetical protein
MTFLLRSAPGSRAETSALSISALLTSRHGWAEESGDPGVALVAADSVRDAVQLLADLPEQLRTRTLVLGIEGDMGEQAFFREPEPGTVWEMLETWRLAGEIPRRTLDEWGTSVNGFIGRGDLMRTSKAGHMKGSHSEHYCFWIRTPGRDVAEFIAGLAPALLATTYDESTAEVL